jgi:hypothetical protein
VHGKNHHGWRLRQHVEELTLVLPGGEGSYLLSREKPDLLPATSGRNGAEPVRFWRRRSAETVEDRLDAASEPSLAPTWTRLNRDRNRCCDLSVAWIDCLATGAALGRSLIYIAEHATADEVERLKPGSEAFPAGKAGKLAVPIDLPSLP